MELHSPEPKLTPTISMMQVSWLFRNPFLAEQASKSNKLAVSSQDSSERQRLEKDLEELACSEQGAASGIIKNNFISRTHLGDFMKDIPEKLFNWHDCPLARDLSLAEFGGARGLRDEALLDAALARPQNLLAYNAASTIAALAASYAYGIARNHAFVDGNERAAFLSIDRLAAGQVNAAQTIYALADGTHDEPGLSAWIEEHMERQEP